MSEEIVPITANQEMTASRVLERLQDIVLELPTLNNVQSVKSLSDQAESLRYLTKKLRFDQDIQNAAAEAALWSKRRLGELLPVPQERGGNHRAMSTMDIETFSGTVREIGLPRTEASRCVELAQLPRVEFEQHIHAVKEADGELSTAAVLRHITAQKRGSRNPDVRTPALPEGIFSILYADPPWEYDFGITANRNIENHYPTLNLEQLLALPVPQIVAPDAVLFLWVTSSTLPRGIALLEAWGFTFRTCMVWVKDKIGMGFYARQQHELLFIAGRGSLPVPEPANRPSSVIEAPRGRHSEKPEVVYDLIDRMYPGLPRIELFARVAREGWERWGYEAPERSKV